MAKSLDIKSAITTRKAQGTHNKYTIQINNETADATAKRINMAFTDANYEFVQTEANRMGINLYSLINGILGIVPKTDVNEYIESLVIKRTKDNVARRKGNPASRITIKISAQNHTTITEEAEKHNMTITQYVNTVIEIFAQDIHK